MNSPGWHRSSRGTRVPGVTPLVARRAYLLVCIALVGAAALLLGRYVTQSSAPPVPAGALGVVPAAGSGPASGAPAPGSPASGAAHPAGRSTRTTSAGTIQAAAPLSSSPPVSVQVSALDIHSQLVQVGLNTDGTVEVPSTYSKAAWYRLGPTPGALGAAVLLGHVDSYRGPAVFFQLGAMRPGQVIDVTRADGSVAHFRVDAVKTYPKDAFPTETVYGPITYAGLRLVTCGGAFDHTTRRYDSNVVVFASLA